MHLDACYKYIIPNQQNPSRVLQPGFLLAFPAKSIRISVLPIIHFRRMRETDSGIKCLVRQDDGALCTKRMAREHVHRPPLSPNRAFCAPGQWRQAQHKRCHRLCTISRSAHNIRSRQLQRFSARRLRGGFASAIHHPIFRACRHCQTLCESPAGIAMDRRQNPAGAWYSRPADNRPADWTNHSKRPQ